MFQEIVDLYKSNSFDVPQEIRDKARRGLELRRKYGRGGFDAKQAKKHGVGSGVQRASDLMSGRVSYRTVKRMYSYLSRAKGYKDNRNEKGEPSAGMIAYLLWGGEPALSWSKRIIEQQEKKIKKAVPDKYLSGLSAEDKAERKKEIKRRSKQAKQGKVSYEPMHGDDKAKTKPSKYTRTQVAKLIREETKDNSKKEFIRASSKVAKAPRSIIEQVYDRGLKAWATSGHRAGTTAQQWAIARVYSFLSGGKTSKTADKDLFTKWKS